MDWAAGRRNGFFKGHPLAHGFGRSKRIIRSAGVAVKIPLQQAQGWFQHQTGCIESPCPAEWADKTGKPILYLPVLITYQKKLEFIPGSFLWHIPYNSAVRWRWFRTPPVFPARKPLSAILPLLLNSHWIKVNRIVPDTIGILCGKGLFWPRPKQSARRRLTQSSFVNVLQGTGVQMRGVPVEPSQVSRVNGPYRPFHTAIMLCQIGKTCIFGGNCISAAN